MENQNPTATPAANGGQTATPADNGGTNATPAVNGGNTANASAGNQTTNEAGSTPFKTFSNQEEFDRYSAGISNNAQKKAEKELLALLGLKPDEKDKLAKFKEAYDATLSESERKAKELESLSAESKKLKATVAEKDAIITAIAKSTGKNAGDVLKIVRMAKGLVDENTTMEQALEQVLDFSKGSKNQQTTPTGTPPNDSSDNPESNPFKTGNLTEQGKIFKADPNRARELYKSATGKKAPW